MFLVFFSTSKINTRLYFLILCCLYIPTYAAKVPVNGFMENKGQVIDEFGNINTNVKFIYESNGFKIILKKNSFSYEVFSVNETSSMSEAGSYHKIDVHKTHELQVHRVDISFYGCNISPEIVEENVLPGNSNYYNVYNKPLFVHSYQKVTYRNIYCNIDLEFSICDNKPKYNFILHPGADINDIKMNYAGMNRLNLDSNGNIDLSISMGNITESIPLSFQKEDKKKISVKYEYKNSQVGFKVRCYNKKKTLIIDPVPVMKWGRFFGGPFQDSGSGVDIDGNGNIIITGTTFSPNVSTVGAYQTSLSGTSDAYLAKFNTDGQLIWATYFGGEGYEYGNDIAVDFQNNLVITGMTRSLSNISTSGAYQTKYNSEDDGFVCKFDATGILLWSTYYGGSNHDYLNAVCIDHNGNIAVAGETWSKDSIASQGAYQFNSDGGDVGFVAQFNGNGERLWATYLGNSGTWCTGIDCDSKNNLVVTGFTEGTDKISSPASYQATLSGGLDAFVVKFHSSGSFLWGTFYGGEDDENNYLSGQSGIKTDGNDNILITGLTNSKSGIATPGSFKSVASPLDVYLAKFNKDGNLVWATYYGGESLDKGFGIAIDKNENIILSGMTESKEGIATSCSHQDSLADWNKYMGDGFVAKFTKDGNRIWGTYLGNISHDAIYGVTVDSQNEIIVTGNSYEFNTPYPQYLITPQYASTINGNYAFVAKLSERTLVVPPISASGPVTFCPGDSVALTVGAGEKYKWTTGDTTQSIQVKQEGNYYATVTDSFNCPVKSQSIEVKYIRPTVTVSGSNTICSGDNVSLTSSKALSYSWSTGDTTQSVFITEGGSYYVTVKDTNGCVSTSSPQDVTEVFPPYVFLGHDTTLCEGITKEIKLNIAGATYLWMNGSTSSSYTIDHPGIYNVAVTLAPCPPVTHSVHIKYTSNIDFNIPNLITPNFDGENEFFQIGNILPDTDLKIYDRWGALIFHEEDYYNNWWPYYEAAGIYYYLITNPNNCVKDYTGWIQVIK